MYTKRVWYSSKTDIKSPDTIHQVLMFGKLSEIQSLKKKLGEKKIKEAFLRFPKKKSILMLRSILSKVLYWVSKLLLMNKNILKVHLELLDKKRREVLQKLTKEIALKKPILLEDAESTGITLIYTPF